LGADYVLRRFKRTMIHIGIRFNGRNFSLFSSEDSKLEQLSLHSSNLPSAA
jgi:hypothetical protein